MQRTARDTAAGHHRPGSRAVKVDAAQTGPPSPRKRQASAGIAPQSRLASQYPDASPSGRQSIRARRLNCVEAPVPRGRPRHHPRPGRPLVDGQPRFPVGRAFRRRDRLPAGPAGTRPGCRRQVEVVGEHVGGGLVVDPPAVEMRPGVVREPLRLPARLMQQPHRVVEVGLSQLDRVGWPADRSVRPGSARLADAPHRQVAHPEQRPGLVRRRRAGSATDAARHHRARPAARAARTIRVERPEIDQRPVVDVALRDVGGPLGPPAVHARAAVLGFDQRLAGQQLRTPGRRARQRLEGGDERSPGG